MKPLFFIFRHAIQFENPMQESEPTVVLQAYTDLYSDYEKANISHMLTGELWPNTNNESNTNKTVSGKASPAFIDCSLLWYVHILQVSYESSSQHRIKAFVYLCTHLRANDCDKLYCPWWISEFFLPDTASV